MNYRKVAEEQIVNTTRDGNQVDPRIVALDDGGYTIAWYVADGNFNGSFDVQQFDATGAKVGSELIFDDPGEEEYSPDFSLTPVHNDTGDDFLIAYQAIGFAPQIHVTHHPDQGLPGGLTPAITSAGTGFALFWQRPPVNDEHDIRGTIYVELYNESGAGLGEITLARPNGTVLDLQATELVGGGVGVVWQNQHTVYADVRTATGAADPVHASEFVVSTMSDSDHAKIAALAGGGFVVVFDSTEGTSQTDATNIRARVFDEHGNPLTSDFVINDDAGYQGVPDVAALPDGGFVAVWLDRPSGHVKGQAFNALGAAETDIFIASTPKPALVGFESGHADVAVLTDGSIVVTWQSNLGGSNGIDIVSQHLVLGSNVQNGTESPDTLTGGDGADDELNGYGGSDTLSSLGGADTLFGGDGSDTLNGGGGDDRMFGGNGVDDMSGGAGDDTYTVESVGDLVHEAAGEGNDRIYTSTASYALAPGSEVEILSTSLLAGTTPVNLAGNEFRNALYGNDGVNVLNGGGAADTLVGLGGDDQYFVDNAGDVVMEAVGGGSDRVFASVSYALRAGQEIEKLTTTNNDGAAAINLTGNEFANVIYGNAGNNMLDGKGGADTLVGLGGDDSYYVDNGADTVYESTGGGTDRVFTSVSYALRAGQEVEKLTASDLAGVTAINLTGNEFANTIYANAGNNSLNGGGGVDTLVGLGGDDLYYVDNSGDQVYEHAGEGNDRVLASASYTLKVGQEIEKLTTAANAGTAAIDLTGNELANTIYGNAGDNTLDGRYGNDTLMGLEGEDHFLFDTALNASGNVDRLGDFSVLDDKILLDHTVFTSFALTGALPAEAFHAGTAASDADDRIIYNAASGALFYDPDGTGAAAATMFAIITHPVTLSANEFVVV